MKNYFQAKVKYAKTMDNGQVKTVSEPYLVDAVNFADTEKRVTYEVMPFTGGWIDIIEIKKATYSEVVQTTEKSAFFYYECKLQFITLDEKSSKETKTTQTILVQAASVDDASNKVEQHMKGSMMEYTKVSVKETKIVDIFNYENHE